MDEQTKLRKLHFYVKLSGWLGAVPTVVWWNLFRIDGGIFYLLISIFILLLSLYILITSNQESWERRSKIITFTIISVFFTGLLTAIPFFLAIKYTKNPA